MSELVLRNRQRVRRIDTRLLRRIVLGLLAEWSQVRQYQLGIHLVAAPEMTKINESFLAHQGSTDVITFSHADDSGGAMPEVIHGELFVCMEEAAVQARQFRTTWQSEVVRYIVHGMLHLLGHDDKRAVARRRMKREENLILRRIAGRFPLSKLEREP